MSCIAALLVGTAVYRFPTQHDLSTDSFKSYFKSVAYGGGKGSTVTCSETLDQWKKHRRLFQYLKR